jgi:putative transposase
MMRLAPQEIRTFFVTAITWQRRPIFRAEPLAHLFVETLYRYRDQRRFLLHEFVLMPDHFHLLLTLAFDVSLEKALQLIKGGFSFRVKREMKSNIEIWQEGYTEHRVLDSNDYQRHAIYIQNNPVRKGLTESASAYPYSSSAPGARTDSGPPWLKPEVEGVSF